MATTEARHVQPPYPPGWDDYVARITGRWRDPVPLKQLGLKPLNGETPVVLRARKEAEQGLERWRAARNATQEARDALEAAEEAARGVSGDDPAKLRAQLKRKGAQVAEARSVLEVARRVEASRHDAAKVALEAARHAADLVAGAWTQDFAKRALAAFDRRDQLAAEAEKARVFADGFTKPWKMRFHCGPYTHAHWRELVCGRGRARRHPGPVAMHTDFVHGAWADPLLEELAQSRERPERA